MEDAQWLNIVFLISWLTLFFQRYEALWRGHQAEAHSRKLMIKTIQREERAMLDSLSLTMFASGSLEQRMRA